MLETKEGQRWSIPAAANSIKALFFVEGLDSLGIEGPRSLRYSEIRRALKREGTPMSPRTLSRALDLLESRSELVRQKNGKEVRYSLAINLSPERLAPIWVNADSMMVQSAARIGAVGIRDSAWTVYGIPVLLGHRIRAKLRREVEGFQNGLDDVLDAEADRVVRSILRKTRITAPKKLRDKGERALWRVYERVGLTGLLQAVSLVGLASIEYFAPGALARIIERIGEGLPSDPEKALVEVARRLGESTAEAEAEFRKAQSEGMAIDGLLGTLSPRDREVCARQFADVLAARANLCAVVR